MIAKLIMFPFWILSRSAGLVISCVKLIAAIGTGMCRFAFTRVLGSIFGALIGAFLGGSHIRVKIWPKK